MKQSHLRELRMLRCRIIPYRICRCTDRRQFARNYYCRQIFRVGRSFKLIWAHVSIVSVDVLPVQKLKFQCHWIGAQGSSPTGQVIIKEYLSTRFLIQKANWEVEYVRTRWLEDLDGLQQIQLLMCSLLQHMWACRWGAGHPKYQLTQKSPLTPVKEGRGSD